ncbi:MAG TPA: hypothetical protein VEL11_06020 [Candidatus Bathyarchaeia archaeon]|nr:hypothetical protein [Candidatus Bathyarchaeia archaeon]
MSKTLILARITTNVETKPMTRRTRHALAIEAVGSLVIHIIIVIAIFPGYPPPAPITACKEMASN